MISPHRSALGKPLVFGLLFSMLFASPAAADFVVTRLTPNFNPGSLPHVNSTALHLPVDVDFAPGNSDYLFISQLGGLGSDATDGDDITKADGRIVLMDRTTGAVNFNSPFLTIGDTNLFDPVFGAPEVGLFSTAFHPDFATNGLFYVSVAVNYPGGPPSLTPRDPRTPPFKVAIREYVANPNNIAAGASLNRTILEIDQPAFNHNGSWLGFNPLEVAEGNNYLYITMGDGGDQHDPQQYGQDLDSLLGTVMRIDIDGDDFAGDPLRNYAIPADNPFVGTAGRDEIWAYGLRNPWRGSFDSLTGDFFVGDVGQGTWEEINYLPFNTPHDGPRNFGWRAREGFVATPTGGVGGPPPADNVDPLIAYRHGSGNFRGNSVAGGVLYRGPIEELYGMYIFADSISGNIWGLHTDNFGAFDPNNPGETLVRLNNIIRPESGSFVSIVSFAEDEFGNLLIVDHGYDGAGLGGHIYRLDFVLAGDNNGDGLVDAADYVIWRDNLGTSGHARYTAGDADGDGDVDQNDYLAWRANFGNVAPQASLRAGGVVPEPSSLLALCSLALLLAIRRRAAERLSCVAAFAVFAVPPRFRQSA
jgi:hypothetical protein